MTVKEWKEELERERMKSAKKVLTEVLTELKSIDMMTDERNYACYCDGIEDAEVIVENKILEVEKK